MPNFEIEKKFLIKKIPENITSYSYHIIEQGYLCTNPVVRIRKQDYEYYLTYKGKGMMIREEYNLPLTKDAYEHLLEKVDGNIISKIRYLIPLPDDLTVELDLFKSPNPNLILAEVEFPSEEAADSFQPPSWFGEEVTKDSKYHNSNMSKATTLE
ncbi:MAG: CYTH domain-containing protein [Lachnospiraceae bacterium]|nr:CYTH domain-containing protein [Lachnospiraceae bacterium]